jgi:tetratricopeptide (TPR) repeat protein
MIRVVLRVVLIGAVVWASTSGGAWAEPAPATDKKDVAKRYVDAGLAAQQAGDYDTAIGLYEKAYQLVSHPVLIFDLAQALRLAGRLDEALGQYRRYVAIVPTGPEAQTARDFIAEIEAKLASSAQAAHDTPGGDSQRTDSSKPPPDVRSDHGAGPSPSRPPAAPEAAPAERPAPAQATSQRVALGLGTGALVLLGAAAGFDHWAYARYRDARAETMSDDRRRNLESSANTRYYIAQALAATGIGCAGAAVWLYFVRRDSTVATSAMRHELVVSPTGIAVIGSF